MKSMNNHSFQMEHSPRGAEASFSLGWVGHGGGFTLEEGHAGKQDVVIGYERGGVVSVLPYCQASLDARNAGMADFIPTNEAGEPALRRLKINYLDESAITRELGWGSDVWTTPGMGLALYTPVGGIPDPEKAEPERVKDAVAPAILGKWTLDNRGATARMRAFFAVGGLTNLRLLEDETGGQLCGVASLRGYGFAVETGATPGVQSFADFNLEHFLGRPNPVKFRLASMGGIWLDVPPGETREVWIAFGWYRAGIVTSGKSCAYLYTRYFADLPAVMRHAFARREAWVAQARQDDQALRDSRLNADQQFLLAKATRSYYGSTQLFLDGGVPRWVVNEGSCNMANTLDLTVDMAFFELRQHPWALRNVLDSFADEYCYRDQVHAPGAAEPRYPGGISFTHDQGTRNAFTPPGESSYEIVNQPGCFSYMTHEELLNWLLTAALYVRHTADRGWLARRAPLIVEGLQSLLNRDHYDPACRDGVMDFDSCRCGRESEITTYDSLDASLGQARRNTYLAVKTWAGYLAVAQMLETHEPDRWSREIREAHAAAKRCAATVTRAFNPELGYVPALLENGDRSAIIPIIEGLVYPHQLGLTAAIASDGPYALLLATLKKHLHAVLKPGVCLFPDGGWKLSGNNDNSWMSKIFLCQFVARQVLGMKDGGAQVTADRAHADWWRIGCAGHSVIDQVIAGGAPGEGSIYPRCVTAILWLEEENDDATLVQ